MLRHAHLANDLEQAPTTETVKDARPDAARSYLTRSEVEQVIEAAGKIGRHRQRDATLILIGYRHGLRVSELVGLRWNAVNLREAKLFVTRAKNGSPSVHELRGVELRALRRLQRENTKGLAYVFETERGGPLTVNACYRIIVRAGERARVPIRVHPHVLRHACGHALADAGHDLRGIAGYLGHKSIQNTMRYTELSANRFGDFWRD